MRLVPHETNPLARMIASLLLLLALGVGGLGYYLMAPAAYGLAGVLLVLAFSMPHPVLSNELHRHGGTATAATTTAHTQHPQH